MRKLIPGLLPALPLLPDGWLRFVQSSVWNYWDAQVCCEVIIKSPDGGQWSGKADGPEWAYVAAVEACRRDGKWPGQVKVDHERAGIKAGC